MVLTRVYSPNRLPSDKFYTEQGWYVVSEYGKCLRAAEQPPPPSNKWYHYKMPVEYDMRTKFKIYGRPKKDKSEAVKARERVARKKATANFFDLAARKKAARGEKEAERKKKERKMARKYDHPPGAFFKEMERPAKIAMEKRIKEGTENEKGVGAKEEEIFVNAFRGGAEASSLAGTEEYIAGKFCPSPLATAPIESMIDSGNLKSERHGIIKPRRLEGDTEAEVALQEMEECFPSRPESKEHAAYIDRLQVMGAAGVNIKREDKLKEERKCCMFCRRVRCSARTGETAADVFEDVEKRLLKETEAGYNTEEPVKAKIERALAINAECLPEQRLMLYGTRSLPFCAELRLERRYPDPCIECNQTPCRFYQEAAPFLPIAWSMFREGLHVEYIRSEAYNHFMREDASPTPTCVRWMMDEVFSYGTFYD